MRLELHSTSEKRMQANTAIEPSGTDANDHPIWNSVERAARRLDLSRVTIYTLINDGALRSFKFGRRRLISETELQRFIRDRMGAANA